MLAAAAIVIIIAGGTAIFGAIGGVLFLALLLLSGLRVQPVSVGALGVQLTARSH